VWAATIAAAGLALAAPSGPAEIAYVHGDAIWSARADGSGAHVLIAPPRHVGLAEPRWSPDGTRLAYTSSPSENASQIMLFDGVAARPVTPLKRGVADGAPAWSPDGTRLAFTRTGGRRPRDWASSLVVRDLATGAERVLARVTVFPRLSSLAYPSWSPDGRLIAYTRSALGRNARFRPEVRVVGAAGGASRTLVADAQDAAWSPDGRRLAFSSTRDRHGLRCGSDECWFAGELYTADATGHGLVRLTRTKGDEIAPEWSPDGSRILFTSDRTLPSEYAGASEVYSAAADGSCLTWLTDGTPASFLATWRPGSGDRYDPGSCDPATRALTDEVPAPAAFPGGLWLGANYDGLLYTHTERDGASHIFDYDDCARFAPPCSGPAYVTSEPACRMASVRGLADNPYHYLHVHGALVAYYDTTANARVLSGPAITSLQLGDPNRVADVRRAVAALRPLGAAALPPRLAPPEIPRGLARALERTARVHRRLGAGAARALHLRPFAVRSRLRLRAALGRYRVASC
jgi:dipeptidyl aminopeptidase/acylaminoacyl peptidase